MMPLWILDHAEDQIPYQPPPPVVLHKPPQSLGTTQIKEGGKIPNWLRLNFYHLIEGDSAVNLVQLQTTVSGVSSSSLQ